MRSNGLIQIKPSLQATHLISTNQSTKMYTAQSIIVLLAAVASASAGIISPPPLSAPPATTTSTSLIGGCGGTQDPNECCRVQLGSPLAYFDHNLNKCVLPASSSTTATSTSVSTTITSTPTLIGGCGGTQFPDACCAAQLCNPRAVWDANSKMCVIAITCGETENPNACCAARFGADNVWDAYYNCCVPIKTITVTTSTVTIPCNKCPPTTTTYTTITQSTCPPTITYTTLVPTSPPPPPKTSTVVPPPPPPANTCAPVTVTQTKTIIQECKVSVFVPASSCFYSVGTCVPSVLSTSYATPV